MGGLRKIGLGEIGAKDIKVAAKKIKRKVTCERLERCDRPGWRASGVMESSLWPCDLDNGLVVNNNDNHNHYNNDNKYNFDFILARPCQRACRQVRGEGQRHPAPPSGLDRHLVR